MRRNIRFGVAAAAALTFVPAWANDAKDSTRDGLDPQSSSSYQRLEARLAQVETTLDNLQQGSGSSEPSVTQDDRARDRQQQRDAHEEFLHQVWSAP